MARGIHTVLQYGQCQKIIQKAKQLLLLEPLVRTALRTQFPDLPCYCQIANFTQKGGLILWVGDSHWATRIQYQSTALLAHINQHTPSAFPRLRSLTCRVRPQQRQ